MEKSSHFAGVDASVPEINKLLIGGMKFELKFEGYKNKQADIVYQIVFRRRFSTGFI